MADGTNDATMTPPPQNERPNILFVLSDQHRADVMGSAGNEVVVTPNLDRLVPTPGPRARFVNLLALRC